ncbi:hypothetical protein F7725_018988, partial [Dissostichus mawsoni]
MSSFEKGLLSAIAPVLSIPPPQPRPVVEEDEDEVFNDTARVSAVVAAAPAGWFSLSDSVAGALSLMATNSGIIGGSAGPPVGHSPKHFRQLSFSKGHHSGDMSKHNPIIIAFKSALTPHFEKKGE